LIRNNSAFRKDLFKRLRREAIRVATEVWSRGLDDQRRDFGLMGAELARTDADTLERFAAMQEFIAVGQTAGKWAEKGILRGLGRLLGTVWAVLNGTLEANERSQYGPADIEGWIGACLPAGGPGAGHCGFYDPNYAFRDIDEMVPQIMKGH
jgi:hypothetical protein